MAVPGEMGDCGDSGVGPGHRIETPADHGAFHRHARAAAFWRASLGEAFSPEIPKICKSYLELLACYLIFIGALGLSLTLARRREPV